MNRVVSILSSGMGLGVYVPSLLLDCQLRKQGILTENFVVESYFSDDKLEKLKGNKKAFHDSFQVAVLGHKMASGDVKPNLDTAKVNELLDYWERHNRRDFIILSGHWPVILDEYIERIGTKDLHLDAIRMDSDVAPSWKKFTNEKNYYHEIWLFDFHKKDLTYRISIGKNPPTPFPKRQNRYLIHGGGWGMGTYQNKIKELNDKGFSLDIVAYEKKEINERLTGNRYFLIDPEWSPWQRNADGGYKFPPTYEVRPSGEMMPKYQKEYQAIFDVCRECKAIISKPGGGTLVDSLASATPVVFIDPIAKHEQTNATLWQELGLGISYDRWSESGYSEELLEQIHLKLLEKRAKVPDYATNFITRYEF